MSDDSSQPDWSKVSLSDDFIWADGVSGNGHPFKIGALKPKTPSTADADQAPELGKNATIGTNNEETFSVASKVPFDIKVDWPRSYTDEWFDPTAEETRTTSITRYSLQVAGPFGLHQFSFSCTEPYHFYFYDKTGDWYGVNVLWPRPWSYHTVYFWSSNADIVRVTGS
ncbi:uncharacterized protein N7503_006544 [Penicillium pulvis]|uniref:uncharacterized protein n=1 Tax=Penicillium pulvis TaxID=1562058 RepID=UPI002548057E|nr:uncharacterized protein N7503_006544 [Penicillium pulvis]KAJ5799039.1 hypothetical protein N7503_006544 [Penicillium pulvis]